MTEDERTAERIVEDGRSLASACFCRAVENQASAAYECPRCYLIRSISAALRAARAQAVEEAAGVAECFDLGTPEGHTIAAAIRALPAARRGQ